MSALLITSPMPSAREREQFLRQKRGKQKSVTSSSSPRVGIWLAVSRGSLGGASSDSPPASPSVLPTPAKANLLARRWENKDGTLGSFLPRA